jgi:hypothetical protein
LILLGIDTALGHLQNQKDWEKLLLQLVEQIDNSIETKLAKNQKLLFFKVFDAYLPNQVRKSDFDSFRSPRFERLLLAITTKMLSDRTTANDPPQEIDLLMMVGSPNEIEIKDIHGKIEYELDLIDRIKKRRDLLHSTVEELTAYYKRNNYVPDYKMIEELETELAIKEKKFKEMELEYNQDFGDTLMYLKSVDIPRLAAPLRILGSKYGTFTFIQDRISFFKDGNMDLLSFFDSCIIKSN